MCILLTGRTALFKRRLGVRTFSTVAAVVLGAGLVSPVEAAAQRTPITRIQVQGLDSRVEILTDTWGVPHVYGANSGDVFLAQGFNAAADRLFQIDLHRRRGLGELAEVFGSEFVEQDRASRLFLYRGDMSREWESYGPEGQLAATRFAAGVNAYLGWLDANPDQLPEEFRELGYQPSHWTPEDVVRIRTHALGQNLASEVSRAHVACAAGLEADRVRVRLQPEIEPAVPDGFDPCTLPDDVLDVFDLATSAVQFDGEELRMERNPQVAEGSNAWAVSADRTSTGRPILANDPHRAMNMPSSRYLAHLNAPGLNVIGAGDAAAPGVAIGHNEQIAFGLTVFPIDQEDLYVYELDPEDPTRYRYGDDWEAMETVTEQVPVAGAEPASVDMSFTRHGPVIKVDEENNRAYAVRTVWLEPGTSPYTGSLKYLRARNYGEFTDAMRTWGTPAENQVYADTAGNIAQVSAGMAPQRTGYDGLLPVPGDGRYEWAGFHDGAQLPRSENPEEGFVATANEYNLPDDYPVEGLSYEWNNPSRHQRIVEELSANSEASVADSVALQNDRLSVPARRLQSILSGLSTEDAQTQRALDLLTNWDGVVAEDSGPAALFEVWMTLFLGQAFVRTAAPEAAPYVIVPDNEVLVRAMEEPEQWFPPQVRDQLMLASLSSAFEQVSSLLGADPATWKWGSLQRTTFTHPAAGKVDEATQDRWNVGPFPRGGSWYTVDASLYNPMNFQQLQGASLRTVFDVGNWDASRAVNTPGQSGNPESPHYRDLAQTWQQGETFPLVYSRTEVLRNAEQRVILLPGQ